MITVLNKKYEDATFVKEVLTTTNTKPPNVILYSEEQMISLRSSIKNGCIIGIDRTFNVVACYLTVTTFRNIIKNESNEPPIIYTLGWYLPYLPTIPVSFAGPTSWHLSCKNYIWNRRWKGLNECYRFLLTGLHTNSLYKAFERKLRHNLKNCLTNPEVEEILNSIFSRSTGLLTIESDLTYKEIEN